MTGPAKHTLYRFFDAEGVLLYVGRTVSPSRRWREHERSKEWFDQVATVTRKTFATAELVADAERQAIINEHPLYNIALVPQSRRHVRAAGPVLRVELAEEFGERHSKRLDAVGEAPETVTVCRRDETTCECAACHDARESAFENLRAAYDWHPSFAADIDKVERDYYAGADLSNWYYDLGDVEMFPRLHLVQRSAHRALPAFADFSGDITSVGCPFCLDVHEHYLRDGAALSQPLEAPCSRLPGGRYYLVSELHESYDALYAWADAERKQVAA